VNVPPGLLRCAMCGEPVERQEPGPSWTCGRGHVFGEVDGIPRLLTPEDTQGIGGSVESFGFQWTTFEVRDAAEDAQVFVEKTGLPLSELQGKLVMDAGCGGGRYARLAAEHGAEVVAMDLSAAVRQARASTRHLPNVTVVQGNLLNPPLAPGSFDIVYSIGVLHHTPDTHAAFRAIARLVKPGGHLAVWLYRRNTWPQEIINTAGRTLTTRMPRPALLLMARAGAIAGSVPLLKHLNKVINFSAHPRWETRVCDTFDWWAPRYQFHHTEQELVRWFQETGFESVRLLHPDRATRGGAYARLYHRNVLIGSGVNAAATRRPC
jgi:2-polyprenyl-3-methyl-5-hydroxy-6-metoxy-1,4-benzoquinol methylase